MTAYDARGRKVNITLKGRKGNGILYGRVGNGTDGYYFEEQPDSTVKATQRGSIHPDALTSKRQKTSGGGRTKRALQRGQRAAMVH